MDDRRYETDHTIGCWEREPHEPHWWTTVTQTTHRCGGLKPIPATADPDDSDLKVPYRYIGVPCHCTGACRPVDQGGRGFCPNSLRLLTAADPA